MRKYLKKIKTFLKENYKIIIHFSKKIIEILILLNII